MVEVLELSDRELLSIIDPGASAVDHEIFPRTVIRSGAMFGLLVALTALLIVYFAIVTIDFCVVFFYRTVFKLVVFRAVRAMSLLSFAIFPSVPKPKAFKTLEQWAELLDMYTLVVYVKFKLVDDNSP